VERESEFRTFAKHTHSFPRPRTAPESARRAHRSGPAAVAARELYNRGRIDPEYRQGLHPQRHRRLATARRLQNDPRSPRRRAACSTAARQSLASVKRSPLGRIATSNSLFETSTVTNTPCFCSMTPLLFAGLPPCAIRPRLTERLLRLFRLAKVAARLLLTTASCCPGSLPRRQLT
jgi:hypothetical protein